MSKKMTKANHMIYFRIDGSRFQIGFLPRLIQTRRSSNKKIPSRGHKVPGRMITPIYISLQTSQKEREGERT